MKVIIRLIVKRIILIIKIIITKRICRESSSSGFEALHISTRTPTTMTTTAKHVKVPNKQYSS